MVKETKGQKGITLVALVITVIVLLILAGVAMSMISGQDGLFAKANTATSNTNEQSQIEALRVGWALAYADTYDNNGVQTLNSEDITVDSKSVKVMTLAIFKTKIGDTANNAYTDGVEAAVDTNTKYFKVIFGSAADGSNAKTYYVDRVTGDVTKTIA